MSQGKSEEPSVAKSTPTVEILDQETRIQGPSRTKTKSGTTLPELPASMKWRLHHSRRLSYQTSSFTSFGGSELFHRASVRLESPSSEKSWGRSSYVIAVHDLTNQSAKGPSGM